MNQQNIQRAHRICWQLALATFAIPLMFCSPARADEPIDLTFDDVKFPIEMNEEFERSKLTPEILKLHGKRIQIRGYIRPSFKQSGIEKFILVRDNQECCFGPGAMLYDCMIVRMTKGTSTEFTTRPITVEGQFYLKEFEGPDGRLWAIFRMKTAKVL